MSCCPDYLLPFMESRITSLFFDRFLNETFSTACAKNPRKIPKPNRKKSTENTPKSKTWTESNFAYTVWLVVHRFSAQKHSWTLVLFLKPPIREICASQIRNPNSLPVIFVVKHDKQILKKPTIRNSYSSPKTMATREKWVIHLLYTTVLEVFKSTCMLVVEPSI